MRVLLLFGLGYAASLMLIRMFVFIPLPAVLCDGGEGTRPTGLQELEIMRSEISQDA